ncbi:MAG: glycosyltransferase [Helicobacter sp.]|nr:glycosyltransferase [Helicobacter sp.]MDY5741105.1 glycosyltransferase [Helicobacter sp.]
MPNITQNEKTHKEHKVQKKLQKLQLKTQKAKDKLEKLQSIKQNRTKKKHPKKTNKSTNSIPKVSVIIPVYNVEQYLRECLDSVTSQTLKQIEIICVDDGSTDKSPKILKEYASKDTRIKIIRQENKGQSITRNKGLQKSLADYIVFLDSDDWIDLDFLEKMYQAVSKSNADMAKSQYLHHYKDKVVPDGINTTIQTRYDNGENLEVNENSIVIWATIYKSDLITKNNIYFREDTFVAADVEFTLKTTFLANKIIPVVGTYVHYRRESSKLSMMHSQKFKTIPTIHAHMIDFLNNIECDERDYIEALKKMSWRINDRYKSSLNIQEITDSDRIEFLEKSTEVFAKAKYIDDRAFDRQTIEKLENYIRVQNTLIISLTSYPTRINRVHLCIETLLNQSLKPDKLILWLAKEQFPNREDDLPQHLLQLKQEGLDIQWCSNIRSYKKLIPTLKKYPDALIITADDDINYPRDWAEILFKSYVKDRETIWAHRVHRIVFDQDAQEILPYNKWGNCVTGYEPSFLNFATSGGGVLYPPNCFDKGILNEKKALELCPSADDIWFWAHLVLANRRIGIPKYALKNLAVQANLIPGTQLEALYYENMGNNKNDKQLKAIFAKYPKLLETLQTQAKVTPLISKPIGAINLVKNHLAYKFGREFAKCKNPLNILTLPFSLLALSIRHNKRENILSIIHEIDPSKRPLELSRYQDYPQALEIQNSLSYKLGRVVTSYPLSFAFMIVLLYLKRIWSKSDSIKVSIIIPVYNSQKYLRECLDSVTNQTLKQIEIICIDDGSTDNSLEILKEYASKDERISILTQTNLYAGAARNAGLAVAKGEYIQFVDSDDWFDLNMCKRMYAQAKKDGSDIVVCGHRVYDEQLQNYISERSISYHALSLSPIDPKVYKANILAISNPATWNKLYKREFLLQKGLKFEALSTCNDLTFTYSTLMLASKISLMKEVFITYRTNSYKNITATRGEYAINIIKALKALQANINNFHLGNGYKLLLQQQFKGHIAYELNQCTDFQKQNFKYQAQKLLEEDEYKELVENQEFLQPGYKKPIGAVNIIKNDLFYKVGRELAKCRGTLRICIFPFTFLSLVLSHRSRKNILEAVYELYPDRYPKTIDTYSDYHESNMLRATLSYKLGYALVTSPLNFPIAMWRIIKRHRMRDE